MLAPASPDLPGFEPVRALGTGASCQVWLMREKDGLRRPVAVKLFHELAAWRRELEALRRVEEVRRESRCAGLVQSLASGESGGVGFIAFEWLEGGTLQERVAARGPLPFADAVACVREAAEALALLHARGIFHRDVKPSNLLLGSDGRVRLADFGLSRLLDGTLSAAGSPAFAAPEVIAGRAADGRRLDVYSLGATLAWLLTGETMLPGKPDVFLLERHGVPRPLQGAIVRAMAYDPAERIASVEELLEGLGGEGSQASPYAEEEGSHASPYAEEEGSHASPYEASRKEAWRLIERAGYVAAAAGSLPLPGSEWLLVLPIHVTMVVGVGQTYGVDLERKSALDIVSRIGSSVGLSWIGSKAATTAAKLLLPGLGGVGGAALLYAATLALGHVTIAFFEREGDLSQAEIARLYRERLSLARESFDPDRAEEEAGPDEHLAEVAGRLVQVDRLLAAGLISEEEHRETWERILASA